MLTCDRDEYGGGVLAVLVLCVDPELSAVPALRSLDLEDGAGLGRLDLKLGPRRRDGLVLEKPHDLN